MVKIFGQKGSFWWALVAFLLIGITTFVFLIPILVVFIISSFVDAVALKIIASILMLVGTLVCGFLAFAYWWFRAHAGKVIS